MSFGSKIREIRESEGRTQEWLAAQLKINIATLSRYETDKIKNPGTDFLDKLCDVFDISSEYFLTDISLKQQRAIDKQIDLVDKLVSLPSFDHYKKIIEMEYNALVLVKANQPVRKRYRLGKNNKLNSLV